HIYAIGDAERRPIPVYGGVMHRLESERSALEQAKQAVTAIVGRASRAPEVPWFWSDQYGVKQQIAGVSFDADRILVRGDPASGAFSVFHLAGERIVAVEAVNAPADFMGGHLLINKGAPVDDVLLVDPAVSVKAVAKTQA